MTEVREREQLPRLLGVWGIWLLAVNGLIGAGIFGLPSVVARLVGEYSPIVYVICALVMLPITLCFAELSSRARVTGGPARYSTEAFGPFVGFQTGWLFYLSRVASFAANSALLVDSIGYFWPGASEGAGRVTSLVLICGGFTLTNVVGSVRAMRSLAALTMLKLAALFVLVTAGLVMLGGGVVPHFTSPMPAAGTFGTATLVLIYAFSGFESALVPAGESRNPSRDMPVALLTALGAVTVLYIVIQVVSAAAVPDIGGSASPLLDAAHALMGPTGAAVIALGVIASVGGNLLGSMFSAPRLTYALALDGSLPRAFATVHPRFLTPAHSILFYGSLTFLLAVIGSFAWLAATAVLARLILYMLACAAVPRLRRTDAGPGGLRLPGGHLFPLLGIVACVWLTLQVERNSFMLTAGLVGLGTLLYALAARQMRPPAPAASLD